MDQNKGVDNELCEETLEHCTQMKPQLQVKFTKLNVTSLEEKAGNLKQKGSKAWKHYSSTGQTEHARNSVTLQQPRKKRQKHPKMKNQSPIV